MVKPRLSPRRVIPSLPFFALASRVPSTRKHLYASNTAAAMSISPKHLLYAVLAFFTLIGMLVCGSVLSTFFSGRGPEGFVGAACKQSKVCHYLPLPPQTEAEMPMAVDERALLDNWGFVIFRAPNNWQEAFRKLYPQAGEFTHGDAGEAESMARRLDDPRIHHFITSRKWQPFHTSHPLEDFFITALRDESGEYLLVFFNNF